MSRPSRAEAPLPRHRAQLVPVAVLALVWGCLAGVEARRLNRVDVSRIDPPFAALGLLGLAHRSIRVPRALGEGGGIRSAHLRLERAVLFGVQQLPAGRDPRVRCRSNGAVLARAAQTAVGRKTAGSACWEWPLLGDDVRHIMHRPRRFVVSADVNGAAAQMELPLPQAGNRLDDVGWIPLAVRLLLTEPLRSPSAAGWFALVYNFPAGTLAHWAGTPRALAARCGFVDVLTSGADRWRFPECCCWARRRGVGGARAGRGGEDRGAMGAKADRRSAAAGQLGKAPVRNARRSVRARQRPLALRELGNQRRQRLGREPRVEVRFAQIAHRLPRFARRAAHVRQQHDFVHR